MKRVRIKENSKKMREMVQKGEGDLISCKIYPMFEPGVKNHCEVQENRDKSIEKSINVPTGLMKKPEPRGACHLGLQKQEKEFKKKQKPEWAMSQAEQEKAQDEEISDLLDFMDNFDAKQYAEDIEVKSMMEALKTRVTELKKETNWKENWENRLKEKRRKREEEYLKEKAEKAAQDDDNVAVNGDGASQIGIMGGSLGSRGDAKTVLSERTQGRSDA